MVQVKDNKPFRFPGFVSHGRFGRKQSIGLIPLVERLTIGPLDGRRTIFGKGPVRAEQHVEFHRNSFDDNIISTLVQNLEARLSIEAGRLADVGCGENRDRTGECRLVLR